MNPHPKEVKAKILLHRRFGPDFFRLTLLCPEIARLARPGQFVMLKVNELKFLTEIKARLAARDFDEAKRTQSRKGGEKKMLGIGRALMASPKMIMFDEPSLGLSPKLVQSTFEMVVRINKELGITVLLVEQNASLVTEVTHKGYVLEVGKVALEGSPNCRLSNRPMDFKPHRQGDRRRVWGSISPLSYLEASGQPGMELSETRTSSIAEERRRNCPLEAIPMAPYKKRPKDLGPVWSSSMSLASCLSQTFVAPGLLKDKPRSSITSTDRIESPPSMHWWYRRNGNAWHSISASGGGI
jgi:hypothetical protein